MLIPFGIDLLLWKICLFSYNRKVFCSVLKLGSYSSYTLLTFQPTWNIPDVEAKVSEMCGDHLTQ